jgi:hypothetical protein
VRIGEIVDFLLPLYAVNACAQLSRGRVAAEAIPRHGYVVTSKELQPLEPISLIFA